jgi:hypothetical protein
MNVLLIIVLIVVLISTISQFLLQRRIKKVIDVFDEILIRWVNHTQDIHLVQKNQLKEMSTISNNINNQSKEFVNFKHGISGIKELARGLDSSIENFKKILIDMKNQKINSIEMNKEIKNINDKLNKK